MAQIRHFSGTVHDEPVTVPLGGRYTQAHISFDAQGASGSISITYRSSATQSEDRVPQDNQYDLGTGEALILEAVLDRITFTPSGVASPVGWSIDALG